MFPTNRIQDLEEDLRDADMKDSLQKLVIVILLLMMTVGYCSLSKKNSKEVQQYKNTLSALQDSFKLIELPNDTFWQTEVIPMSPSEIMNSPEYQDLKKEKQKQIEKLSKEKNLLAGIIFELKGTINPDTLFTSIDSIDTLDSLNYADTSGNFQFKEKLIFSKDTVTRVFQAMINLTPEVIITKEKDGVIMAKLRIPSDDIHIDIRNSSVFYLRETKQEKRKRKIIKGLKYTGLGVGSILLGTAAFKIGQNF